MEGSMRSDVQLPVGRDGEVPGRVARMGFRNGLRGLLLALGLSVSASAWVSVAKAQTVSWQAPIGCPTEDEAVARLSAVVEAGRLVGHEGVRVRVVVRRGSPDQAEGSLEMEQEITVDGTRVAREVTDTDCDGLLDAAVLFTALALDVSPAIAASEDASTGEGGPESTHATSAPEAGDRDAASTATEAETESAGESTVAPPGTDQGTESRTDDVEPSVTPGAALEPGEDSPQVFFGAGLAMGRPTLPRARPTLRVGMGVRRGMLRIGANVGYQGPPAQTASLGPAASVHAWTVEVDTCGIWGAERASALLCGSAQLGRAVAKGLRTDTDRRGGAPLAGAGGGLGMSLRLISAWHLELVGWGRAYFARPRVLIDGFGEVHRWPRFAFSGSIFLRHEIS